MKKAAALTSRSMITPFLESFPEEFSVEVDGDTYIAKLAGNEVAAQPAKRKTPSSSTVKGKILTIKRAGVGTKRTTTRTRRILK